MARIKSYAQDTNVTDQDRILGTSYEGMLNNKPIYKTRNYKVTDLASYFSQNFDFEGVNYNLSEIKNTVDTTFDIVQNLGNSLGSLNNDGSLASISVNFANDLVSIVSTVPDLFTELALSNLSAVPKAFADFLFTIADANEAFANQVLDLATSVAYATADQFNALELLVTNNTDDIDAITGNITSLTTTVDNNTGSINANALQLDLIGTRVTTAEANVVALQTDIVELNTDVNTNTGDIATQATQLSLIGTRVTTSEANITNLQSDFTNLSTTVDGNTGNIATNATQISSLNTVVQTANTNIAALQTDVTILETSINNVSGEVAANASDISLLTTNVNTVTADVTALQTDVTVLTTTVNDNTGDIATQATQVSLLANRVDTAEADILNTKTDVTQLTSTVDGNTGNIATNASNISILQTNVSTTQADIVGIITDIQQIETSVDNVTGDVETNAIAINGLATRVTTAEADVVNVAGNITTLQTDLNTQTGRIDTNVQSIDTLGTIVTNNFTTLNASITTVNNARISGDTALSTRIDNIESQITNIPVTIRQNEEPGILDINNELIYPLGSIWVDTNNSNAIYILIEDAGAPSGYAWSPTTSEALGDLILSNAQLETQVNTLTTNLNAESTKVETLTSQFGFYDPATNTFTIDNNAAVVSGLRTYADAESAAASKVDSVGSTFGAFNPTTNAFTVSNAKLETIVDTLTLANYASTTRVDTLEAKADSNLAAIQSEAITRAGADSANATYSFNIASSIGTVDANGNITAVSEAFANSIINTETTDTYAEASRVDTLEATVGDASSGLVASVNTNATAVADINGNLNASYGVYVNTAGKVAGLKLLATGAQQPSQFIAQADTFAVDMPNGTRVLTVDSGGLVIDGSGSFSGSLTAGNVLIQNSIIDVKAPGQIKFNDTQNARTGLIYSDGSLLRITADNDVSLTSNNGGLYTAAGGTFLQSNSLPMWFQAQQYDFATTGSTSGGFLFNGNNTGNFQVSSVVAASITAPIINNIASTQFYVQSGSTIFAVTPSGVTINGSPVGGTGGTPNYYLSGITRSGNTLTFVVEGTADVQYTFGANAFTSDALTLTQFQQYEAYNITSIDTDRWDTAWGWGNHASVGYLTAANVTQFIDQTELNNALSSYALASSVPTDTSQLTNGAGYITASAVGNGTVSITGSGRLQGSGTFTLNQSGPANIEITHKTLAPSAVSGVNDGLVVQSIGTDGYGHVSSITTYDLDGRYLRTLPTHNHNDLYYTEAEINSLLANYITAAYVSDATINVVGSGVLGGSGSFTLNGGAATISITHDTSPQGSTAFSGGTVIQNVTLDAYGHITDVSSVNLDGRYLTSLPSHTHDDRYYTENEVDNLLTGYATVAYVNGVVPTSTQESQWTAAYNFSVFGGTVSGDLYANDFILNSDATLKENIKDYVARPINIKYKNYNLVGDDSLRVGVIAQELEKDHPEFVKMTDNGTKAVSYIDMLVAKIAELEDRIKQLENGSTT